jgi:hypothetical protein
LSNHLTKQWIDPEVRQCDIARQKVLTAETKAVEQARLADMAYQTAKKAERKVLK